MSEAPTGYLGYQGPLASGPSSELVEAGFRREMADVSFLHHGLGIADLAHVVELAETNVIPPAAASALAGELLEMLAIPADEFPYDPAYGDAYNSRERELERRMGALAGWLPTGRTRREAGRLAFRLALRERLVLLHERVAALTAALCTRADDLADIPWNDTTYLQPAQPSTFGHYLAGFAEAAARNLPRLEAAHRTADVSPSGSGGVAGTAVPLHRDRMAHRLGFAGASANIRDGMWSADVTIDVATACVQSALVADRLAEDLEIFASPQFGYVRLGGSSSRASVLLPQKRNPYALSVIRAQTGVLIGRATGLMVTQRTPSARTDNWLFTYGEAIGAVDATVDLIRLATVTVTSLEVDTTTLTAGAGSGFSTATDLAERLVLDRSVDYRTAYRIVGRAVAMTTQSGRSSLAPGDLTSAAEALGITPPTGVDEVLDHLDQATTIATSRDVPGGSAPARVREHCASLRRRLADASGWSTLTREHSDVAERELIEAARRLAGETLRQPGR